MGRYATPRLTAPPLPTIENGVEVLICEARLAHRVNDDPDDSEEEQLATVFVSFDPQPAQRYAARNLAGSYIAAQSTFEQLPVGYDLVGWLIGVLGSRVAASVCVVWSLPHTYSEETAHQIEAVITGLRTSQHHLQLAVAVSVKPAEWRSLISIDGFVAARAEGNDGTPLEVFNMLSSLMAPGLTACLDAEDLRAVFGTSQNPSRLASCVWFEGQNLFMLAADKDRQVVRHCSDLAFMPLRHLRPSSLNQLLIAIRKFNVSDAEFVMITPYGLSSAPLLAEQIVPVLVIAVRTGTGRSD